MHFSLVCELQEVTFPHRSCWDHRRCFWLEGLHSCL